MVVLWLLTALLFLVPAVDQDEASVAPLDPQVRTEFLELAPFLSMDAKVTLEILNAAKTKDKLSRIKEYAAKDFSAHPLLSEYGNGHMQYLVRAEAQLIPVLRAQSLSLEDMLVEAFSRIMERNVVRQWQREADNQCRAAYQGLLPLAKQLASPIDPTVKATDLLECEFQHSRLHLLNTGTEKLTNVTLVVEFESIFGEKTSGYYFLPEWAPTTRFAPRLPLGSTLAQAQYAVEVSVELLGDQCSVSPAKFRLPENREKAAKLALQQIDRLVLRTPDSALEMLKSLKKSSLPSTGGYRGQHSELRKKARERVKKFVKSYEGSISKLKKRISQAKKQLRSKMSQRTRDRLKRSIARYEAQLAEARKSLKKWKRVR